MSEQRRIIVAAEEGIAVRSLEDVNEAIGAAFGADGALFAEGDLGPAFFDLRSGIAGELFQKATNYRVRLAIVVADPAVHGARFAELAFEHRAHPLIRFFASRSAALAWLTS